MRHSNQPLMNVYRDNLIFPQTMFRILFLLCLFFQTLSSPVHSAQKYVIDSSRSTLACSVNYVVLGKYKFEFKDFEGSLWIDDAVRTSGSMSVTIDTQSLISSHPHLDSIAHSALLLDTEKYPTSQVNGNFWLEGQGQYMTQGSIQIRDQKKTINFPFDFLEVPQTEGGLPFIRVQGTWVLPRKDFGIVWQKFLDKGGLVVGNHVTIDWDIVAVAEKTKP